MRENRPFNQRVRIFFKKGSLAINWLCWKKLQIVHNFVEKVHNFA